MPSTPKVAVIINPISGTGGRPEIARERAELAAALLEGHRIDGEIFVTERPGHARELTTAAVARGATLVIAWGGDGTVNETASALAFTPTPLAIVPSGSGNGLARELQVPLIPREAFRIALDGADRRIDGGEMDGRLFFNIAGVGLDARVAQRFAANGLVRRGFARYIEMTLRELMHFEPEEHVIATESETVRERVLMIAIANGRQYGNGALIAPAARLDDGRLDVVVVAHRSALRALTQVPRVFAGRIDGIPGVHISTAERIEITSAASVVYHVDGEPFVGAASIRARVRPSALTVRVPRTG